MGAETDFWLSSSSWKLDLAFIAYGLTAWKEEVTGRGRRAPSATTVISRVTRASVTAIPASLDSQSCKLPLG